MDMQAKQKTFSGPGGGGGGDCLNCFIILFSNQKFLRSFSFQCFMNSILQCLSHTRPLREQLLRGSHTKKINSSSGMKGKLIQGMLMSNWLGLRLGLYPPLGKSLEKY